MNKNIKNLLFLFNFFTKKILDIWKKLSKIETIIIILVLMWLYYIKNNLLTIDYYNQLCTIKETSLICNIELNLYLLIPEILLLIPLSVFLYKRNLIKTSEGENIFTNFSYLVNIFVFLRFLMYIFRDFNEWYFFNNFYIIGNNMFLFLLIVFFINLFINKNDVKIEEIKKVITQNKENKEVVENEIIQKNNLSNKDWFDSIKKHFPSIFDSIINWKFEKNLILENWIKIKWYKSLEVINVNETLIKVIIDLDDELKKNSSALSTLDWTLFVNTYSEKWKHIIDFRKAEWFSENWETWILIHLNEKTIDMTEKYPYPYLFETNPLIKHPLDVMIWKTRLGEDKVINLWKMPHLMIAWSTWMWKSVEITDIITSLQKNILHFGNDVLHINIVDPKVVDFDIYKWLSWIRVVNEPSKALNMLKFYVAEMERRYSLIAWKGTGDKNIDEYNSNSKDKLSYEVIIMDEIADLMMGTRDLKKEFEHYIARLWQKARAAWIHLVLWTQRPDADIITWIIKANIPSVIWFWVTNSINSRIIMDDNSLVWIKNQWECILKALGDSVKIKSYFMKKEDVVDFIEYYKKKLVHRWTKMIQFY